MSDAVARTFQTSDALSVIVLFVWHVTFFTFAYSISPDREGGSDGV